MSADLVFHYLVSPNFIRGAGMTLLLTIASLFFGIVIGLVLALIQESKTRIGRVFTLTYLWLFRGTPVLFQIIFIYNVLPSFGIKLTAFVCAVAWIFPGRSPAPEEFGIVSIPAVAHVPWAAA